MQFTVAVALVGNNAASGITGHDVALLMEPYRDDPYSDDSGWWSWYTIESEKHTKDDPVTWAVIGTDGKWYSQCHLDEIDPRDGQEGYTIPLEDWKRELDDEFWDRLGDHAHVVRLRCKD